MVTCWSDISAIIDCLKMWLVSIKRSSQGLLGAINNMRKFEELMEIWLNEVCNNNIFTKLSLLATILYSTNVLANPNLWDGNFGTTSLFGTVRRMESSNYSGDKWWPTYQVIQQILIDSLIEKRDLERSKAVLWHGSWDEEVSPHLCKHGSYIRLQ